MKRWAVDMTAGRVELAALQNPMQVQPEYVGSQRGYVFVLAVDELGAFVRAKQVIKEQTND